MNKRFIFQIVVPLLVVLGINFLFPLTFSAFFIICVLAFIISIFWDAHYTCWSLIVSAAICVTLNYMRPSADVYNNAAHHIIALKGYERNGSLNLINSKNPKTAVFDNKDYIGNLTILGSDEGLTITENISSQPVYVFDNLKKTYHLINGANLISFANQLSFVNRENSLKLDFEIKKGKRRLFHLRNDRDSLQCIVSFKTKESGTRIDTADFDKIIKEGYPLVDLIRSAGVCSTAEENLISVLKDCYIVQNEIGNDKVKDNNSFTWFLTIPEGLQKILSNNVYTVIANGSNYLFRPSTNSYQLAENTLLYIGCGASKSRYVSFSKCDNGIITMNYDMPVMFNFPHDSISQKNKIAAISTSSEELTSSVVKEAFYYNLFQTENNVHNFGGTILYQTGPTLNKFSANILDTNSPEGNKVQQNTIAKDKYYLTSVDKKGKWILSIPDLKRISPIFGQSNGWLNEWLILTIILSVSVFAFLTLFLFGDEEWSPNKKSVSVFQIWMFLVPMITLRLYLLWRIAVFPPVENISKEAFLRYRLENGHGLDNAMILTLVCIGIFAILTLAYFVFFRYKGVFNRFNNRISVIPSTVLFYILMGISIAFSMTGMVIGNIAIPVLVFFICEYLCLLKLSLPFRVVNTLLTIGLLVKGDPGYAIMFVIFVSVYYIIQTVVFRNSGTADGVQRNAAWKLCLGLSLFVGFIIIFSPILVSLLYDKNEIIGIPITYYVFFVISAFIAYVVIRIINISYGKKVALRWSAVACVLIVVITIVGPVFLENNKHFKYRSLIHTQDVGQIMMNEDVADRDNQRLLEASQNQWFLQHHSNLGEQRITEKGILHLFPHFKKGVSWSTQISDVICARYIIGELSLIVPLAIITFVFVFFLFALRHRTESSIGKSISYGVSLLLLIQTTFVWMANTNRMIFFGQDFPFMSQNAKATLLMFVLLLFMMIITSGNDCSKTEEERDGLTEYGFDYFNRRPIKVFFVMFLCIFGIVYISGNKYSSLYGTRIATEFNAGEAMQQAERDISKINSILAAYPAQKPLKPHGENLTKTIKINDIITKIGLDHTVAQMEANNEISPFSASLYRAFRENLQNDNHIGNIIHLRYISATESYVFGLNNGFYSLRAPEMKKNVWSGNIYAYEDLDDTDHLLTSSDKADRIDIYRIPNSWLREGGSYGIADVRYVDRNSKLTLHSSENDYDISSGLFVVNSDETIECNNGGKIFIDQLSGYKEKVLAKNMIVNGENKFFYPMRKDFFWIKDFSEMAASQKHGSKNCHLTIDKELQESVVRVINGIGKTCSVVALDGRGNVRLMAENNERDEYNMDPNDAASIENFVENSYLNPNYAIDSKVFGNQNLLYMLPGPGSSLKPITYAAVTSQISPQIINWSSLRLHAPNSAFLKEGYYLMDKFGPDYTYSKKTPFKSIAGDEIGIEGWVDNKFYLYKSSNYYNALITYLGNYDKSDLGSMGDILKQVSDFNNYPTFQINGINYCFKNSPSERRQNSILNTGLSINFNMNVSYDDKDSTQFVSKEWINGVNPVYHPWVFPASSNAFMRDLDELDEALRLKQYTLGSSPLRITPLMMAEMYGRLVSMHPDFHACITDNNNRFTQDWDAPSPMDRTAMFNFYQRELFTGMSQCVSIGTARVPLSSVNTNGGSLHLYAKTGTLTLGNNIKDDRMLAVIITNKDILTASSPEEYKFYVIYFRFKQTGSMYNISEIINNIISSKSFVSYMKN